MAPLQLWLLYACLAYSLLRCLSAALARRRKALIPASEGCRLVLVVLGGGFMGIFSILGFLKATREQRSPQQVTSMFEAAGRSIHTIRINLLGFTTFITRDPEIVRNIFVTNANHFDISATRFDSFEPLLGPGVSTLRGEAWRRSRSIVRPQFYRDEIANLPAGNPYWHLA